MKQIRMTEKSLSLRGTVILEFHDMEGNHLSSFDCKTDKEPLIAHMKIAFINLLAGLSNVEVIDGDPLREESSIGERDNEDDGSRQKGINPS
ncbi:MAG: hypothetical protein ACTSXE_02600 [Candidatus Thorarchaeota archaeon]